MKQKQKSIKQVHDWLKRYTHNFKNEYYMGLCVDTADELINYITNNTCQPDNYEQWELYDINPLPKYKSLLLIIPDNLCGTFPPLADWEDADFFHVVIKYKGYFWDGSGKYKSLKSISNHYTQCKNPHWFRT